MTESDRKYRDSLWDSAAASLLGAPPFNLQMDPVTAMALIAQIQLALRHPQNTGATSVMARKLANDLINLLPEDARELAKLGFDPRFDV